MTVLAIVVYLFYGCLGYWAINPVISGQAGFKSMYISNKKVRIAARASVPLFWPVWVVGALIYGCYSALKNLFKGFLE